MAIYASDCPFNSARSTGHPGLPLTFAPFVVTDPHTLAELETVGLPDAALPRPVYRINEYQP